MIVNAGYRGKVGAGAPKFTYTGQYNIRKDGVVELLTSGTIVFLEPKVIDVFMVGGGGGGAGLQSGDSSGVGYGGGGGGYTRTVRRIPVSAATSIAVTIGEGGAAKSNGNSSGMGNYTVSGGYGVAGGSIARKQGGYGGSGGGGGVASSSSYGAGGSDGGNGEQGVPTGIPGGNGQQFTTREFGEATGKLYAGGGGGGRYMSAQQPVISMGGAGGGGAGGWYGTQANLYQAAAAGVANTGGGGGGGAIWDTISHSTPGASGGSGIVCFRDAAELPELAGTWVFNERLYPPEKALGSFNISGYFLSTTGQPATFQEIGVEPSSVYFTRALNVYTYYNFSTNKRTDGYSTTIVFPSGATASDEFRAWLASNATKQ